jgi:hypothetical protein
VGIFSGELGRRVRGDKSVFKRADFFFLNLVSSEIKRANLFLGSVKHT